MCDSGYFPSIIGFCVIINNKTTIGFRFHESPLAVLSLKPDPTFALPLNVKVGAVTRDYSTLKQLHCIDDHRSEFSFVYVDLSWPLVLYQCDTVENKL